MSTADTKALIEDAIDNFQRQVPALGDAHARYARTIPTALAKITRAVKARDADAARSAMVAHIEQWARFNPEVSNLTSAD